METVNREFRLLRQSAGLTQKEIERLTGIYCSKISYFEHYFATPTDDEAKKLARAFKVTVPEVQKCFPDGVHSTYGHKPRKKKAA